MKRELLVKHLVSLILYSTNNIYLRIDVSRFFLDIIKKFFYAFDNYGKVASIISSLMIDIDI